MRMRLIMGMLLSASLWAGSQVDLATRNFWHPQYHGQRLAYCDKNGKDCGASIANAYCQLMGYEYASQQIKAPNVGLTNYLGCDTVRCKGWECHGFMNIVCATHLPHKPPRPWHYTKKRFAYPRLDNYRVDWCYQDGKGCGRKVAQSFCRRLGFMQAVGFAQDKAVYATRSLGDRALCFGAACNGFKEIQCSH